MQTDKNISNDIQNKRPSQLVTANNNLLKRHWSQLTLCVNDLNTVYANVLFMYTSRSTLTTNANNTRNNSLQQLLQYTVLHISGNCFLHREM